MATKPEIKTSPKKPKKKKENDNTVDIKRGTCSSNWQNFQSKKLKTESTMFGTSSTQSSNTSKKINLIETANKIREKENFTRKPKVYIMPGCISGMQLTTSKPDLKTSLSNTSSKESKSPVAKRRARVQSKRNQINAAAIPFIPRHTPTNTVDSSSIPFANMSLCHSDERLKNDVPGTVYYKTLPQPTHIMPNVTRVVTNTQFKIPAHLRTYMCRTTFQVPFMSTTNLAVNDLMFLRQPGVIGSVGVWPVINEDVCVGMDCEMVGVGTGRESMLARVSLVNMSGECIYDTFVYPQVQVVDFRTSVSGVRPNDINFGADFHTVRQVVATLIHNRILVGHALKNDLEVLGLTFPKKYIRDTAYYAPFKEKLNTNGPPSLKRLAKDILNVCIQDGEHSSIEDARAAMQLYVLHRQEWEKHLRTRRYNHH
ncbi:RNA exonuclease 4 [Chrysoperla carnea]|uniref:RNA exonuclease 4 n=1 Tax=Chrysoperla carnea TaxID=189513 RepID=UPI001D080641|nr:RNA exonuclease 4 [Chrysoperla carnea]